MNKLIESINYASDSYWGDPERFKFNAKIDTYNNITEITQGDNRVVKTNFGLTIQGYLIPDSLNKELTKPPQKRFNKAVVSFGAEIESLPMDNPQLSRREVREITNPQNVKQSGIGVGYSTVGAANTAIGGAPVGINLLYDFRFGTGNKLLTTNTSTIGTLTGRRLIQWSDQSGNNNNLQHNDYSLVSTSSMYYPGGQQNMPFRPIEGGEEPTDYPNSDGGLIFSTENNGAHPSISSKLTSTVNVSSFTKIICFYLSSRTTSSFWGGSNVMGQGQMYYAHTPSSVNTIVSGFKKFDIFLNGDVIGSSGSVIQFEPSSSLDNGYPFYSFDNSGNEVISIQPNEVDFNSSQPAHEQTAYCLIPPSSRPQPNAKHILTINVDNSNGAIKLRLDGNQIFTTGSSNLKDKTFSFDFIGNHSFEYVFEQGPTWNWME
jgi:hypothetical protein